MRAPQIEIPKMSNLRASRLEAGLTPAELAERVGVHRTTIVRAERGLVQLGVDKIARISRVLGTTVDELLEPEMYELPKLAADPQVEMDLVETPETATLPGGRTVRRVPRPSRRA